MKPDSIEILVEADDIKAHMRNLWRTEEFRKSQDEGGLIAQAVNQFATLPRFFFTPSDQDTEAPHFCSWWSGVQKRDYDNDAIHDLYYLHEIWHAGTMPYVSGLEFSNFQRKMIDNELDASTISEMAVYFEMPELRKKSFPYEIFVDRFLFPDGYKGAPDAPMLDRWKNDRDRLFEELRIKRRNVMSAPAPNLNDDVEFWMQKFTHQNEIWAHLWYARYNLVETAMVQLREDCRALGRREGMTRFMRWLASDEVMQGSDIPFPDEAKAFSAVYALNKKLYKSTFERIKSIQPVTYKPTAGRAAKPA